MSRLSSSEGLFSKYFRCRNRDVGSEQKRKNGHCCRSGASCRRCRCQKQEESAILFTQFNDMLKLQGISQDSFVRSLTKSTNPKEAFLKYLTDFDMFLDSTYPSENSGGDSAKDDHNNYNHSTPTTASFKAIKDLQKDFVSNAISYEEDICAVCCDGYVTGDMLKQLPCGHSFHVRCIENWLRRRHTCPTCRDEVAIDSDFSEVGRLLRIESEETVAGVNNDKTNIKAKYEYPSLVKVVEGALSSSDWGNLDSCLIPGINEL